MAFIPLYPSTLSAPYRSLIIEDPSVCHQWIIDAHAKQISASVHTLGCYVINSATLAGRGHVFARGKLISSTDILPKYWMNLINNKTIDLDRELELPERTIDETCVVFMGHGISVYGHVLLEMILRLRLFQELGLRKYKILVSDLAPPWVQRLLTTYLGLEAEQIEVYSPERERLALRTAIIPTQLHTTEHFHPATRPLARLLADEISRFEVPPELPSRIVVSRDRYANKRGVQRSIPHATSLWEWLEREHGFVIIRPEELTWAEQIHLFRGARIVVGEYGSGLHNTVFCNPNTIVASLGFLNFTQSAIGALFEQRQAYFTANIEHEEPNTNQSRFQHWIDRLMRQAQK